MKTILLLAIICVCSFCSAAELSNRFAALSQIESADNNLARGKAGERGRFQESKSVFHEFNPSLCWKNFHFLTNADFALASAQIVMVTRQLDFRKQFHRSPTDAEWYLLWHCPARVNHPSRKDKDIAQRFANLAAKLSRGKL